MSGSIRILGRRGPSRQTATPAQAAGAVATDPLRVGLLLTLCSVLAACAQSGDFGRPKSGVWNDVVLPATGAVMAARRGEPVSSFPLTDAEEELRDRSWRFLMPAQERSWFDRTVADLARTRVLPAREGTPDKTGYYRALMREGWFGRNFASPASRFRRIGEDAEADLILIDPFKAAADSVLAADEIRLRSLVYVRDLT
jgi:hypothetical protein